MAHTHDVIDTHPHFTIDPENRVIKKTTPGKAVVIQFDHNSERITFDMPRYVEGHDMTLCTKIEVHYINIKGKADKQKDGVYPVTDLAIDTDDKNTITFSWLISQNSTQLEGSLNFLIRFTCTGKDGAIDYAWHTDICTDIEVRKGMYNTDVVVYQHADILEQWKQQLIAAGGAAGLVIDDTLMQSGQAADARATGDAIRKLTSEIADIKGASDININTDKFSLINFDGAIYITYDGEIVGEGVQLNDITNTKEVHMFILAGQSNMQGYSALTDNSTKFGYEYKSASNLLESVKNPIGENTEYFEAALGTSIGVEFVKAIYKTTNKVPVIVQCAKQGQALSYWAAGSNAYASMVLKFNSAIAALENEGYTILTKNIVWLQGESDALNSVTKVDYKVRFLFLWASLKTDISLDNCYFIRPAKFPISSTYVDIMIAQEELAEENDDIIMSTRITGTFTTANGYMQANGHYTASGYDLLGKTAGTNIGNYILTGIEPILEVEPYEEISGNTLVEIIAIYAGDEVAVGTELTSLTGITVTANYSDGSSEIVIDYVMTGTIVEGTNTITVTYRDKTTTFDVVGIVTIDISDCQTFPRGELSTTSSVNATVDFWVFRDTKPLPQGNFKAVRISSASKFECKFGVASLNADATYTVDYVQDVSLDRGENLINFDYQNTGDSSYFFVDARECGLLGNVGIALLSVSGASCDKIQDDLDASVGNILTIANGIGNFAPNMVIYYKPTE